LLEADAQYGLMFQWGEWGYPEDGEAKPWPKMIDDFDVEKFADMVQSTGAGYVIWSATWRTYYFPAPIQAIERIMPGRTSTSIAKPSFTSEQIVDMAKYAKAHHVALSFNGTVRRR
jgi:hypothetical protein